VGLVAIARPTFDVPLAQATADAVLAQLMAAGHAVAGTGRELLMDAAGAARAIGALADRELDLLILLQASFADASMAVDIAQAAGAPVLLWAVPDERDGGRLRLNSLCGSNLAAHALARRNLPYDYVLATCDDPAALAKVEVLARAGRAQRMLRRARIGLVGERPAGFDTCDYDAGDLARLFGVDVQPVVLAQLLADARQVEPDRRTPVVARMAALAPNLDQLDPPAVAGTAGVYVALRRLVDEQGLAGLAVRCWPEFFTELGCAACGAMSLLNEERRPASCEADVNGTVTSLLLQAISGQPAFITDLVSVDPASDTAVLWHCGLAPASMADPDAGIVGVVHSNRKLPLLFEFPLKPGRVTVARLHRTGRADAAYQLVIGGGEMVRAPKSFSGTSGVLRFDRPAAAVLDTVMRHGLEHHFCLTYGSYEAELRAFARLAGLPVLDLT
jgi:L-fucose isomerase-like protein